MPKWFHITVSVLLALLAIGNSILICGEHHWGYIPCAAIAILLLTVHSFSSAWKILTAKNMMRISYRK